MPKKVYDYGKLKLEYFNSEIDSVQEFFKKTLGKHTEKNGNLGTRVAGWDKEKEAFKKEAFAKAKAAMINEAGKKWEDIFKDVRKAEKIGIQKLIKMVGGDRITLSDLMTILDHFRVIQGKPSQIHKDIHQGGGGNAKAIEALKRLLKDKK